MKNIERAKRLLLASTLLLLTWTIVNKTDTIQSAARTSLKYPIENPSVVSVSMSTGFCTGFIVKTNYIATAAHCMEGSSSIVYVRYVGGEEVPAILVHLDKNEDFAVLKTDTLSYPKVQLSTEKPGFLAYIYHIRSGANDPSQLATNGIYAGKECDVEILRYDGCLYFLAMLGIPGDSGGPVFNGDGEVIGIMSMGYWPIGAPMSMAVPVDSLVKVLKSLY